MYLITGGAGFIGSNLAAGLEARGDGEVVVCDWPERDGKGRNLDKRDISRIIPPEEILPFLDTHGGELTALFHMGAISSTTETDVNLVLDTNVRLSMDLWEWCRQHQKRFIYASSAATYGDGAQGFDDDESGAALAALRPLNLYGWSKHLFDRRVARAVVDGAPQPPQWAGLKFFNVFGPNEFHKGAMRSVVLQAFEQLQRGESIKLFKSHRPDFDDGGQRRDFIYVRDCVDVILWLLDSPDVNGLYNLGTGTARTFAELAAAACRALNRDVDIAYIDMPEELRDRYQYETQAEMDRLRAAGYSPAFTSLEDGVTDYIQGFLASVDGYR